MRKAELWAVALLMAAAPLAGCGGERAGGEDAARGAAQEEPDDSVLPRPAGVALPQGVTAEMVGEGRRLFGTTCVVCHGPDARGTQLAPSLRDGEWLNVSGDFGEIERLIHTGVPEPEEHPVPMPPDGGGVFTAEQVRSLAAYVYSLGQGKTQAVPADTAVAGGGSG
ncbi:MAG TPA: c-type cytochrome [Longimicrobiaceae bacterium]|nr:c-type cytochrome [Longimicrobiaceae bacterium]